jgi:hypothetical protein
LSGYRYYLSVEKLSMEDAKRSNRAVVETVIEASAQFDQRSKTPTGEIEQTAQNEQWTTAQFEQESDQNEHWSSAQIGRSVTTKLSSSASSSTVEVLAPGAIREIVERCLAICGPGLADPAKHHTPSISLARRLPTWLKHWDLEADILPILEARTSRPRKKPLHDVSLLETDIAAHHAARIADIKPMEIIDAEPSDAAASRNRNAKGRDAARSGTGDRRLGLFAAAARNRELRAQQAGVSDDAGGGDDWLA